MGEATGGLVGTLLGLPLFQAEWVLWLLIILSLVSVAVMVERWLFYRNHAVDVSALRPEFSSKLDAQDYDGAATLLQAHDSFETNVVLFGLREHEKGADSVQELINGAGKVEKERFDKGLTVLATVASNAPFIGLFGTVLGIIRAFKDLASNMQEASSSVMSGISEALIATAVGLLVAIPAGIAFNFFKAKVRNMGSDAQLLSGTLLAHLKSEANTDRGN